MAKEYRFTTVKHVLEYYMENHGFYVESWSDLANMTRVFIETMGGRRLDGLEPEHFIAYGSGRKRGTIGKRRAKSDGTIRRELIHLRSAINYCMKTRLINPEHNPYIPMPEAPPPRDRWLKKSEIDAIRAATVEFSRAEVFIMIALATGARKKVIETLTWSQVNLETNMINFSNGKKITKKINPIVPIRSDLRIYFEKLRKVSTGEFVLYKDGDIRAALDAVTNRAGVSGVTPHVFRHTYATHASMNGVPLWEIARILGDKVATVEKVYAKFQPGYLQDAMERSMV